MEIILDQILVGPMENFAYIVGCPKTKTVMIVDPAWEPSKLYDHVQSNGYTVSGILVTHGHYDHVDGIEELLDTSPVPVYFSSHETTLCQSIPGKHIETDDHQKITIGTIELECLWTPGHSPGCQCFYTPGILITGDTLFVNGCGRCDLSGGDARQMHDSLYNKILSLPEETVIYPGHAYGPRTSDTLAHQKKTNPYLKCPDIDDFLHRRMGF